MYLNVRFALPSMPGTYVAFLAGGADRSRVGSPVPVTVTTSLNLTAMSTDVPLRYVSLSDTATTDCTLGGIASTTTATALPVSSASGAGSGRVKFALLPNSSTTDTPSGPSASVPV